MLQAIPLIIRLAIAAGAAKTISNVYKNRDMGDLSGTEWTAAMGKKANVGQTINFKDGDISGFGGCNQFFGQYTQDGGKLTIGALASTRKAGPNMKAEATLLAALQLARRFKGTPSEITIYGEADDVLLTLVRKNR